MEWKEKYLNKVTCGHCLELIKNLPNESVHCCITSPPYWGLRDYQTEPLVWDADENCEHEWIEKKQKWHSDRGTGTGKRKEIFDDNFQVDGTPSGFCLNCGAWRGSLGLEPTFELYIKHLCDIFDEVKRVLKNTGTCWVVIGDTYGGSGGRKGHTPETSNLNRLTVGYGATEGNQAATKGLEKSLCLIPSRFSIEMVNRGWIVRSTIIWEKPNCMPSSAKDRFTVDFEYLFFFTKNRKYWFEQQFEKMLSNNYDMNRMKNGRKEYKGKWSGDKNAECFGSPRARTQRKSWDSKRLQSAFVAGGTNGRNKRCVWTIPTKPFPDAHFAVYPEDLIETPIKAGCPPNGIVLDLFMGAGTTAVKAEHLGRQWIGFDLSSEYCQKIAEPRIAKLRKQLKLKLY